MQRVALRPPMTFDLNFESSRARSHSWLRVPSGPPRPRAVRGPGQGWAFGGLRHERPARPGPSQIIQIITEVQRGRVTSAQKVPIFSQTHVTHGQEPGVILEPRSRSACVARRSRGGPLRVQAASRSSPTRSLPGRSAWSAWRGWGRPRTWHRAAKRCGLPTRWSAGASPVSPAVGAARLGWPRG